MLPVCAAPLRHWIDIDCFHPNAIPWLHAQACDRPENCSSGKRGLAPIWVGLGRFIEGILVELNCQQDEFFIHQAKESHYGIGFVEKSHVILP